MTAYKLGEYHLQIMHNRLTESSDAFALTGSYSLRYALQDALEYSRKIAKKNVVASEHFRTFSEYTAARAEEPNPGQLGWVYARNIAANCASDYFEVYSPKDESDSVTAEAQAQQVNTVVDALYEARELAEELQKVLVELGESVKLAGAGETSSANVANISGSIGASVTLLGWELETWEKRVTGNE